MTYFNILFHFSLLSSSHYDSCYEKYFVPLSEHLRTFPIYIPHQTSLSERLTPHITYLIETNQKIIEIGEEVGFNNPSYFTRAFYQKYSVSPLQFSPLQYRKQSILLNLTT